MKILIICSFKYFCQKMFAKVFILLMQLHLCLLQAEEEFRDKLSPIYISLNFSLDPQAPVDQHGLRPILNYQTEQLIEQKVCA